MSWTASSLGTCTETAESLVLILLVAWGIYNSFKRCTLHLHELTVVWKLKIRVGQGELQPEARNLWGTWRKPLISTRQEKRLYSLPQQQFHIEIQTDLSLYELQTRLHCKLSEGWLQEGLVWKQAWPAWGDPSQKNLTGQKKSSCPSEMRLWPVVFEAHYLLLGDGANHASHMSLTWRFWGSSQALKYI